MNQTNLASALLATTLALCLIDHAGDEPCNQRASCGAIQEIDREKTGKSDDVDNPETELRAGLVAEYSELNPAIASQLSLVRIDAKPAFTWGTSSPHPRIKQGPFKVTWNGLLDLRTSDRVQFSAFVSGEVTVTLGKTIVLSGRGDGLEHELVDAREYVLESGLYPIEIVFHCLPDTPARLQVWWQGKRFAKEPLPASRLKHLTTKEPAILSKEDLRVAGRNMVGKLGCARCHRDSFPNITDPAPGPSLADLDERVKPAWLMNWLDSPSQVRPEAKMPILFEANQKGYTERWLITQYLLKTKEPKSSVPQVAPARVGDFRTGRQHLLGLGCLACHHDPEGKEPASAERYALRNLQDRMTPQYLTRFLSDPLCRYPDGRMPKLPVPPATARDLVAYLLRESAADKTKEPAPPTANELNKVLRLHETSDHDAAGRKLLVEKGCVRCHTGLGDSPTESIPLKSFEKNALTDRGCLSSHHLPRFELGREQLPMLAAYLEVASHELHSSPFFHQQRLLQTQGCVRCHQRDSDRPSPLEEIGRAVWTPHLYRLPYQRTPSLTQASAKFQHQYLQKAISEGVSGVRPDWYSYRMPAYGKQAHALAGALIAGDGEVPTPESIKSAVQDPTELTLGSTLVGFNGYGCVSCHVWKGKNLSAAEPSSVGPDLSTVYERIKPAWFSRYVNDPQRIYPGSPMPSIFTHGEPAPLRNILDGDVAKQKAALWAFLSAGKDAPNPQPKEPLVVIGPTSDSLPYVAQVPLLLPNQQLIEGLAIWHSNRDIVLYDLGTGQLHGIYTNAAILRQSNVWRTLQLTGTSLGDTPLGSFRASGPKSQGPKSVDFLGYEFLAQGIRLRWRYRFDKGAVDWTETVQLKEVHGKRRLIRQIDATAPQGFEIVHTYAQVHSLEIQVKGRVGQARFDKAEHTSIVVLRPDIASGKIAASIELAYAPAVENKHPSIKANPNTLPVDEGVIGPLTRPGYRAILYPRPKTSQNEDLVMPSAIAVDPRTGKVFVASMKQGDLFAIDDPADDGKNAHFRNCAQGLFQDCFGMLHDGQNLYVLHRRNLSRLSDSHDNGNFNHSERVTSLPHALGNAYDWAYGLVKDNSGRFLWTLAPHANPQQQGAGSLVRFNMSGEEPRTKEIAFGFRNPLGWCSGPSGETFFTDNQGDWCATNKLCHIVEGQFYGYPNSAQKEHLSKPMAKTTVWIPYDWAKSINGMAYDSSEGKFGPFAGQFFLAELMHGGAIVRAQVEKVNGVYQGACFPFWGKGLLGPLTMAFDPTGRLWVGSITTPGWMGQPDRGALFRLGYTGELPFEIQSIHVRPRGFRLVFTKALDTKTALNVSSFQMNHYRYEYTGAYGSPELDRTPVRIQQALLQADGRTLDLVTNALVKDRIYMISASGVRSMAGEQLIHPNSAYTLNEIPGE